MKKIICYLFTLFVLINSFAQSGRPIINLSGIPASICQNERINASADEQNFCSIVGYLNAYSWSFPGGTPSTSSDAAPTNIYYYTAGTYKISCVVSNPCGTSDTVKVDLIVKPSPSLNFTPADVQVCAGALIPTLNFTSDVADTKYWWENDNTSIGLGTDGGGPTNAIASFTAASVSTNQNAVIKIHPSLAECNGPLSTFLIKVFTIPTTPVTTNVNYCQNETSVSLTASTTFNHTHLWYAAATGGVGNQIAPIPATNVAGTTSFYVSQVNAATGCEGPRAAIAVTINPKPNLSIVTAMPTSSCGSNTGAIGLYGLSNNITYSVSYIKNGVTNTQSLTTNGSGEMAISHLPAGTYSQISVALNSCNSTYPTAVDIIDPTPPTVPTATNLTPVCVGGALSLTSNSTSTTNSSDLITYTWNGPNSFTSSLQNPSISNIANINQGDYFVTATQNNCISNAGNINVVVNETPATPTLSSNNPVCSGTALNLNSSTSFTGALTYAWTGPSNFLSSVKNPSLINTNAAFGGTYKLIITSTDGGCSSLQGSTDVLINLTPVITYTSKTDALNCGASSGSITLNGLNTNTTYAVTYTKNNGVSSTSNIISNAGGNVVIANLPAADYGNIFVTLNNCSSNMMGTITINDPIPPSKPSSTSNSPVCSNGTLLLQSATSSSSASPVTYSWSGPNGFTSTLQNPAINTVSIAATGSYVATVMQNSCVVTGDIINVVINETPATPVLSSNSPVCSGSTLNLTASTSFTGALTYAWTGPSNFSSGVKNSSLINTIVASGGLYKLVITSTNGGCSSLQGSTDVVINPTPVITPTSKIDASTCGASSGSITLSGLDASTTYAVTYTKNNGISSTSNIVSNTGGNIVIANLSAADYSNIFVTLNNCSSNSIGLVTIKDPTPLAKPDAKIKKAICVGDMLELLASSSTLNGVTYFWTGPNNFNSSLKEPVIPNAADVDNGDYSVRIMQNNCLSEAAVVSVIISPIPAAPGVISPLMYCVNNTAPPLTASVTTGNTLNWYTVATGGVGAATAFTPSTAAAGNQNYYVSQINATGCEGSRSLITVTVNNNPIAKFNPPAVTHCAPFNLTAAEIGLQTYPANNDQYNWYANGVSIGSGTTFPGYSIADNDSVKIKLITTSVNGCNADSMSMLFYSVLPHPIFTPSVTQGCNSFKVQFNNTTPTNIGFSYHWDFGNGQTSAIYQPGLISFLNNTISGTDTTYNITLTVNSICGATSFTSSVLVKASPVALFAMNSGDECAASRSFNNSSKGSNNVYLWDFGDGTKQSTTTSGIIKHTYTTINEVNYVVKLVVTNDCGTDSKDTSIKILPNSILLSLVNATTNTTACSPYTVSYKKTSSGATNFLWNFGDGTIINTTDKEETILHTYLTPGNFTISVKATNACVDTTAFDYVKVLQGTSANFSADKSLICTGDSISFSNQSTFITTCFWKFGDGFTSSKINPAHIYAVSGNYLVELIAYGSNGCTDTMRKQMSIQVHNKPIAGIAAETINCSGSNTLFKTTIQSADAITQLKWQISNTTIGTEVTLNYTFVKPGNYLVNFIAGTQYGCYDTARHTILINPLPIIRAGADVVLCKGNTTQIVALATGGANYQWLPVDGLSCSTCVNPMANPAVTTLFKATVTNSFGCSATDSLLITVVSPFELNITGKDTICLGQPASLQVTGGTNYSWSPSLGLSNTTISNPIATPKVTTNYMVIARDVYNCFTATAYKTVTVGLIPKINLGPDIVSGIGGTLALNTIISNGPLKLWKWTPATGLSCANCALPTALLKNDITYIATAENSYGCKAADTINIKIFCKSSQVFIPNAFTPDGDGINDVLMVRSEGILMVKSFKVFNRFGQVVFEKNNFSPNVSSLGWDGRVNGKISSTEVFIYTAEVVCENGVSFTYKGNTTLIN